MFDTEDIINQRDMTRMVCGPHVEVPSERSDADARLDAIGKRIGRKLRFRMFKHDNLEYSFLMCVFDDDGGILVSNMDTRHYVPFMVGEVIPLYVGFSKGSGTMWDVDDDLAKMNCISFMENGFYLDYTLRVVFRKSEYDKGIAVNKHYVVDSGDRFEPVPEASTIGGLVFKMDMMDYGKPERVGVGMYNINHKGKTKCIQSETTQAEL
jgi:hypothetical protein